MFFMCTRFLIFNLYYVFYEKVFDPDLTKDKLWEVTEYMMDSYDNETNEGM